MVPPATAASTNLTRVGLASDWQPVRYGLWVRDPDACARGLIAQSPLAVAGASSPPHGFRAVETYVAVPSLSRPHLLLPTAPRPAARGLRRFSRGSGRTSRLAARAAAVGIRGGGLAALRGSRFTLSVAREVDDARLADLLLSRRLQQMLGRADLSLAVRVGATRPNGKPVAQAMDCQGSAVAFVKIGWNDLTRPLVEREGEILQVFRDAGAPASFTTPTLVRRERWQGFALLVVEPIGSGGLAAGPVAPLRPTCDVASMGDIRAGALGSSSWWADARQRLDGVDHPTLNDDLDRIAAHHGHRELAFGCAHGDWTPWNMIRSQGRLMVWDWERFRRDAPVGQDAIHYAFMVALRQRGRPPDEAARHALSATPPVLSAMGANPDDGPLLLLLHQLEMAIRFAEARQAGVTLRHDLFADQLHALLAAG
jgi:hypothetical protein